MPIYKGSTEVTSGNLYKGSTEVQDGYKATDSFYVNEVSISFLNFPGVTDYVISGAPGDTISVTRSVSWTVTAPSGQAYNGTQTASGVPSGFAFAGGSQGSISNTTTSPNVNFISSVFPLTSTSVDYNSLTVSLPTTTIVTYSYTFTGGLGRSTSCNAFSGSACTVGSNSQSAGDWKYWNSNASGTGGGGAGQCSQSCSVSISSSGGSSTCDTTSGTTTQTATASIVCIPTYANGANPTFNSAMYCATHTTGGLFTTCGGTTVVTQRPGQTWTGGYNVRSSCGTPPTSEIGGGAANNYYLVGRSINGSATGAWEVEVRSQTTASVKASDSCNLV